MSQDTGTVLGVDTTLDVYEQYHLHVGVLHASRRPALHQYHARAAAALEETQTSYERRGNGDLFDPESPRCVVWDDNRRPRHPLGYHEPWVDEMFFTEELGPEENMDESDGEDAVMGGRGGGAGAIGHGQVYGGQPGDLGEVIAQDMAVAGGTEEEPIDVDSLPIAHEERGVPRDARARRLRGGRA